LPTTHMVSIGGWGAPHVDTSFDAKTWWDIWKAWNNNTVAQPSLGFYGFEGIDWDLEGNDDTTSPDNYFSVDLLNRMGEISQLAKAEGYIVSLVPPQSYLDVGTSLFDQSVIHDPSWEANFPYHGYNTYAPVAVKYATTTLSSGAVVPTFDFIDVQLYEGWSRANYEINKSGNASEYLVGFVQAMVKGWYIDFASDPAIGLPSQNYKVAQSQLVIGLANGWTLKDGANEFVLILPKDLEIAYNELDHMGIAPRGFMFWAIEDEGDQVNGTPFYLASGLNAFLKIRS